MSQLLTTQQLKKIAPLVKNGQKVVDLLNELAPKFGLTNKDLFEEYLAQVLHESGEFNTLAENMNYRADRLLKIFRKYFNATTAAQYAHKPQAIANKVYANRLGNGNEASGDGWANRGGGAIQITGKDMYNAYEKYTGNPNVRELVRTDLYWAIHSSLWVFAVVKKLIPLADADKFIAITKAINGGVNGLEDREKYLKRIKKYLV